MRKRQKLYEICNSFFIVKCAKSLRNVQKIKQMSKILSKYAKNQRNEQNLCKMSEIKKERLYATHLPSRP